MQKYMLVEYAAEFYQFPLKAVSMEGYFIPILLIT